MLSGLGTTSSTAGDIAVADDDYVELSVDRQRLLALEKVNEALNIKIEALQQQAAWYDQ